MFKFAKVKRIKKILIIRFSSIGDIVLTSPVIRCTKKQMNCDVHFLTKQKYGSIVMHNPDISRVILLKDKLSGIVKELKTENYDLVIDLHNNIRSKYVIRKLNVRHISFNKLNFKKWLAVNLNINILPEMHLVDRYFDSLEKLGIKNDALGLEYFIGQNDIVSVDSYGVVVKSNFLVWAIGGQYFTKKYPEKHIIDICRRIDVPVFFIGGSEDKERGAAILRAVGKANVKSLCGELTINQSASLIQQSALVVSNDTGMMHIAAAYKKKIISLWGNTIPAFGMFPYLSETKSVVCEVKGLSCRPCSKIGYQKCPKKHFRCMHDISKEEIINAIRELLD